MRDSFLSRLAMLVLARPAVSFLITPLHLRHVPGWQ
jgi:hypothetical protein